MKLDNKGMSMVEIMASVVLISIVLIFLINLFLNVRTIYNQSAIDSEFEVLKSNIINSVGRDISEYGLKSVSCVNNANNNITAYNCNRLKLVFNSFRETNYNENITKILKTYSDSEGLYYISYGFDASLTADITSSERVTNMVRQIPDSVVIENSNMISLTPGEDETLKRISIPLYDKNGNIYNINIYGVVTTTDLVYVDDTDVISFTAVLNPEDNENPPRILKNTNKKNVYIKIEEIFKDGSNNTYYSTLNDLVGYKVSGFDSEVVGLKSLTVEFNKKNSTGEIPDAVSLNYKIINASSFGNAKDYILKDKEILIREDFRNPFKENTTGKIFEAEDDYGTSYYYAGAPDDNYLIFADHYWRIIRINGNGSIRLIYSGVVSEVEEAGKYNVLKNTPNYNFNMYTRLKLGCYFNALWDSPLYVGFTYKTSNNEFKKSTILEYSLEPWYIENILNKNLEKYIDINVGFCGDRQGDPEGRIQGGYGPSIRSGWAEYLYNVLPPNPSFICPDSLNDLYTVENANNGNKNLRYSIGLITSDEILYAGGTIYKSNYLGSNHEYYLYTGYMYWTMSPMIFSREAYVYSLGVNGNLNPMGIIQSGIMDNFYVKYSGNVRPVINLKSDVILTGSGTINDPYIVK